MTGYRECDLRMSQLSEFSSCSCRREVFFSKASAKGKVSHLQFAIRCHFAPEHFIISPWARE